jgi:hypothetical protein
MCDLINDPINDQIGFKLLTQAEENLRKTQDMDIR